MYVLFSALRLLLFYLDLFVVVTGCLGSIGKGQMGLARAGSWFKGVEVSDSVGNFPEGRVAIFVGMILVRKGTNGAAAKVMNFDRLGEKVRPGTSGKIKAGQRECPKGPSVKEHEIRSDPISADPICPFPN